MKQVNSTSFFSKKIKPYTRQYINIIVPLNSNSYIQKENIQKFQSYIKEPFSIQKIDKQQILYNRFNLHIHSSNYDLIKSLILHVIIIGLCTISYFLKTNNYGNTNQGDPVEVVFLPQQLGNSGTKGEGYNGDDNAVATPSPPASLPASSAPAVPTPLTPTESIPEATAESIPLPKEESIEKQSIKINKTKTNRNKTHEYTYKYNQPSHRKTAPQQQTTSSSPFDHLVSPDFSENPNKSKRQQAERRNAQGSRSGMNMSLGPLVKNGKMNHPYSTKISIKGVNDDYGQEIANWIRSHLYYPIDAAKRGESGGPSVHVELDRDGHVLSVALTNSSGSEALDAAITGMFRNAQLPKIPPDLPDHFSVDLKINYILLHY